MNIPKGHDEIVAEAKPPLRRLTCCCCGESTRGRQWRNRDTGYGLCDACIPYCARRQTGEDMRSNYGESGVHYAITEAEAGS